MHRAANQSSSCIPVSLPASASPDAGYACRCSFNTSLRTARGGAHSWSATPSRPELLFSVPFRGDPERGAPPLGRPLPWTRRYRSRTLTWSLYISTDPEPPAVAQEKMAAWRRLRHKCQPPRRLGRKKILQRAPSFNDAPVWRPSGFAIILRPHLNSAKWDSSYSLSAWARPAPGRVSRGPRWPIA